MISSVKSKSIKVIKGNKLDIENKMLKCKFNHKNKVLNFSSAVKVGKGYEHYAISSQYDIKISTTLKVLYSLCRDREFKQRKLFERTCDSIPHTEELLYLFTLKSYCTCSKVWGIRTIMFIISMITSSVYLNGFSIVPK